MNTGTISACIVLLSAISAQCQFNNGHIVDCAYSSWSEFNPVPGTGQVIRTRQVVRGPKNGGQPCVHPLVEIRNFTDIQTPSLSKFLSLFIPGDRRTVALAGSLLGRGQVPATYTLSRDIVLLIDTSLFAPAIPLYMSLLSNLVGAVCGDVARNQTGNIFSLITYDSHNAQVIHSFNDQQTKVAVQNKILGLQSTNVPGSPSQLANALERANQEVYSHRSGTRLYNLAHKDIVLFVTYRATCSDLAKSAGRRLKVAGRVYVVVLGEPGDNSVPPPDWCLQQFASDQFDFHFLWVKTFEDLRQFSTWALDITSLYNACQPLHQPFHLLQPGQNNTGGH